MSRRDLILNKCLEILSIIKEDDITLNEAMELSCDGFTFSEAEQIQNALYFYWCGGRTYFQADSVSEPSDLVDYKLVDEIKMALK